MNMRLTLRLQIHGLSLEDVKKTWCSSNSEKVLKPSNAPQGLKHMSIQQLSVIHKQIHLDHFLIVIWLCKSFMPNFCIATRLIVLSCGIEPSTAACHKTTAEDKCMTGAAKRIDPRNAILLGHHNYLQKCSFEQKHVCCKKASYFAIHLFSNDQWSLHISLHACDTNGLFLLHIAFGSAWRSVWCRSWKHGSAVCKCLGIPFPNQMRKHP